MSKNEFEGDAGAPLPDFSGARNISLTTVAPALGVKGQSQPDYLDFDQKGRGTVVTMFANSGMCYLMGIASGGLYGLQKGLVSTPSSKFKVKVNSVLNNAGRYGSRAGNTLGVLAVLYSLYEGLGDNVSAVFESSLYESRLQTEMTNSKRKSHRIRTPSLSIISHEYYGRTFSINFHQLEIDRLTGIESSAPPVAAALTGISYFAPAGIRVAALGGALGFGAVGATYAGYAALGKPVGSAGLMWF